ncbi:MAG: sigma-70 family RNA polymerase sigma factor [Pirellulales bacterium]
MASHPRTEVTECLAALSAGDKSALERLVPMVYDELRQQAASYLRKEGPGHSLQPTALVHEVFLKLADQTRVSWKGRSHFFAVGAQAMRRILVDHARKKKRTKRGGGRQRITFEEGLVVSPRRGEDVLALDDALVKLAALDPRQAQIVEMRFFGGLTVQEVAEVLGVSKRTVEAEWTMIRAWLRRELTEDELA